MNKEKKNTAATDGLLEQYMVLMFAWDVYGGRICQNVTLRREENGYKRMCLGRLCIYFLYW